jgi:low temperature requirement protein LtrA
LWWTYFGWLKEAMEEGFDETPPEQLGQLARDAYSLTHFPLVCGIIGFAVAVEEILLHPERAADGTVIAALAVGIGLFVGCSALAYWRITHRVLTARLVITAITIAVVALLADAAPVWPLVAVAVGLAAIIVTEQLAYQPSESASVVLD